MYWKKILMKINFSISCQCYFLYLWQAPFNMLNYSIYADETNQANQFFEIDSNGVVRTKAGVDLKTTGQTEFDVSHFFIYSQTYM